MLLNSHFFSSHCYCISVNSLDQMMYKPHFYILLYGTEKRHELVPLWLLLTPYLITESDQYVMHKIIYLTNSISKERTHQAGSVQRYFQVPVHPEHIHKTANITTFHSYLVLSVYSPFSDRVGLSLHNILYLFMSWISSLSISNYAISASTFSNQVFLDVHTTSNDSCDRLDSTQLCQFFTSISWTCHISI